MVNRYPHSILIKTNSGEFVNGVYVPGTETTIETECRIEQVESNPSSVDDNGIVVNYQWTIYCPLFDGYDILTRDCVIASNSDSNPLLFRDKQKPCLSLIAYQKHLEIKI